MAAVTKLYHHVCEYNSCSPRWSKHATNREETDAIEDSVQQDKIVHRHHLDKDEWVTQSFTVQDPLMREHLRAALANYQSLDLELEGWTFAPPYKPIVHRWSQLNDRAEQATDPDSKAAAEELMDFLQPILTPSIASLAETQRTGMVVFRDVWHIFSPGEIALTTFYGVQAACRVKECTLVKDRHDPMSNHWLVTVELVDWNGEQCGYTTTKINVRRFEARRRVTSLPVYPLSFSEKADEIRERLVERGRKFEALRGYHFKTCTGTKILLETKCPEERPVSSRVIIDAFAYYTTSNIVKPTLASLDGQDPAQADSTNAKDRKKEAGEESDESDESDEGEEDDYDSDDWVRRDDTPAEDGTVGDGPEMTAIKSTGKSLARCEILDDLTEEQCMLATPWVIGLDLKNKHWAKFCVTDLEPIVWNDAAFDNLILPGNEKQLAWEFVENKALADNGFDDFIEDKGRGIIILMFGPPGVGKTFTAEAVADRARVPLYAMSAGTLGTVPSEVETALDRALDLCKMWNAMLLLDEADVFLGARTNADLVRNELVAVFLTKLEYYTGVCFLTTNRMSTIDPAFQSRVDLLLRYRDLTPNARRRVWSSFIDRAGCDKFSISDTDLDKLAEVKLNGREIKNIIKSAHLLSLKSKAKIDVGRLNSLIENRLMALDEMNSQ